MDPITVLGLAANIVQFIDFGVKILSKGKEIYDSAEGASKDNLVVEAIINHLKDTLSRIQGFSSSASANARNLQNECTNLIDELLKALDELKLKGVPSKWKSLRKALKSVRSKAKIQQWLQQLESMREEYNTQLEVEILETIQLQDVEQKKSFKTLEYAQQSLIQILLNALRIDRDALEAVAETHATNLKALIAQEHERTRAENVAEAQSTRDHTRAEQIESRLLNEDEHVATRDHVSSEGSQTISKIERHVEATSSAQSSLIQHGLASTQVQLETKIGFEADHVTDTVVNAIDIAQLTTGLQTIDSDKNVVETLSRQLALTQLQIEDLKRAQSRTLLIPSLPPVLAAGTRPKDGASHDLREILLVSRPEQTAAVDVSPAAGGQQITSMLPSWAVAWKKPASQQSCTDQRYSDDHLCTKIDEPKIQTESNADLPSEKVDPDTEDDDTLWAQLTNFIAKQHPLRDPSKQTYSLLNHNSKYWVCVEWSKLKTKRELRELIQGLPSNLKILKGPLTGKALVLMPEGRCEQSLVKRCFRELDAFLVQRLASDGTCEWLKELPDLQALVHASYGGSGGPIRGRLACRDPPIRKP